MNTPATHPREDDAAASVFGQMEAGERIAFVKAMNEDESLRALVDELKQTASSFAFKAPQMSAPAAVRARVLANVKKMPQDGALRTTAFPKVKPARSNAWIGWAAAAVFAVSSAVLWDQMRVVRSNDLIEQQKNGDEIASLGKRVKEAQDEGELLKTAVAKTGAVNDLLKQNLAKAEASSQSLQQQLSESTKAAGDLKQELARVINLNDTAKTQIAMLQSTVKEYKQGVAVVVWNSEKQEGILKLEKMPPVETGKDYQLWVVDPSKKTPVNAGVVRVDAKGFAKVDFKPTLDIQQANNFAISVEKKGGVAQNEGPIVLLSP